MEMIRRFFRIFDNGVVLKWIVVVLFVVGAVLLVFANGWTVYQLVRRLADSRFVEGAAAVILAAALLLATLLALVIVALRGVIQVAALKAERYSALTLGAMVLRVSGEAAMFYFLILAPAACLVVWLSGTDLLHLSPISPLRSASSTFLLGVFVFLSGLIYAGVWLFATYLLAEVFDLLPAIAGNVAAIRAAKGGRG